MIRKKYCVWLTGSKFGVGLVFILLYWFKLYNATNIVSDRSMRRYAIVRFTMFLILVWVVLKMFVRSPPYYNLDVSQDCFQQVATGGRVDSDCKALLNYIRKTTSKHTTQNKEHQLEHWKRSNVKLDCYSNLDFFSNKSQPFPNSTYLRLNYLDTFRQCGHEPKLLSHKLVPRYDNLSLPVPNIVHYIWGHENFKPPTEISFLQYMSVLSVSKYLKPVYILWHGSEEPFGYWWNRTVAEVPNIYFVLWQMPNRISGKWIGHVHFKSDILRLWILIVHGGIYLDTDIIVLRSFDPLRVYDVTVGRELRYTLANGIILTAPWTLYLRMCLESYRLFTNRLFVKNSMMLPNKIASFFPHLVHVEPSSLLYPTWPAVRKLYMESFNWSTNYCVHIFGEETYGHLLPNNTHEMDVSNITLAKILRQVYYDDTQP